MFYMNNMPRKPTETTKAWLRYAAGDLAVAQRELDSEIPVYHTICFLCQSSAEKFIKGFLISCGWHLEKTHDIVELLGYCSDYDSVLGSMIVEGAILNEYIVAGRYPGDVAAEGISADAAKEALEAVHRIRARIMKLMEFN
ncbi:MAG: HEPN domain-containing protein [Chloroflexi bacterium]|nr:HEPN domain-containing protein [Chloroflexota bacterium]